MWNSSDERSNSIPHQRPSLNHSLLCVFEAVVPCGHLTSGLKERGRPKATPARRTITPMTINIYIQSLPASRASRGLTTGIPSLATIVDNYEPTTMLADTRCVPGVRTRIVSGQVVIPGGSMDRIVIIRLSSCGGSYRDLRASCTMRFDGCDSRSCVPMRDGWDSFAHWGRWRVGPAVKALALQPEARQVGLRYLCDSVAGGPRIDRVGDADEPAADPQVGAGRDHCPRPLIAGTPVLVQGRDPAAADVSGRRIHGGEPA